MTKSEMVNLITTAVHSKMPAILEYSTEFPVSCALCSLVLYDHMRKLYLEKHDSQIVRKVPFRVMSGFFAEYSIRTIIIDNYNPEGTTKYLPDYEGHCWIEFDIDEYIDPVIFDPSVFQFKAAKQYMPHAGDHSYFKRLRKNLAGQHHIIRYILKYSIVYPDRALSIYYDNEIKIKLAE